jgi:tol-pal system protein YbgF
MKSNLHIGLVLALGGGLMLAPISCTVLPTEGTSMVSDVNQIKLDMKHLDQQMRDLNRTQASWQDVSKETEKAHFEQLRDRLADMKRRIEGLQKEVAYLRQGQTGVELVPPATPSVPAGGGVVRRSSPVTTSGLTVNAKDLFRSATELLVKEKYPQALEQFKTLAQQFPDSDLAGDALFGVGECLQNLGKNAEAIDTYLSIAKRYPASERVPDATFRAALCAKQMGDRAKAVSLLQEIVVKYPNYEEMTRVKDALTELGGK